MPTKTIPDLWVHVPVDNLEIVRGPSAAMCLEYQERLRNDAGPIQVTLTLKTGAGESSFRRKMWLATMFNVTAASFNFTAIFQKRVVSGVYYTRLGTGWFNLD